MNVRRFPYSPALAIGVGAAIALGGALVYAAAGSIARSRIDEDLSLGLVQTIQALENAYRAEADAGRAAERVAGAFRPRSTNLVIWDREARREYNARQYLPANDPALVFLTVPKVDTIARMLDRHATTVGDYATATTNRGPVRVHMREVAIGERHLVVAQTRSLAEVAAIQAAVRRWAIPWFIIVYLVAILPAHLVVRRAIARVQRLTDEARQLEARSGPARLSAGDSTAPIEKMVEAINRLLARKERDLDEQRTLLALISHELRTPVAVLSAQSQHALDTDDAPVAQLRATLRSIRQEAGALSRLVDDLFLIARSAAGEDIARPAPMYLDDLVRECASSSDRTASATAPTTLAVAAADYSCLADEAMLRRAIMNLLNNARRHAGPAGDVRASLGTNEGAFVIDVWNDGPPIPAEDQPRVFDRFFQGRESRGAAGLGLQVVRVVAAAHRGDAHLVSSSATAGTLFRLTLPLSTLG